MSSLITAYYPPHTNLGESPLYRAHDNTLHYIDVLGKKIHILELHKPHKLRTILCPEPVSFLSFAEQGGYLVCYFQGIATVSENGDWKVLREIIPDDEKHLVRLNDGGIDSSGRLWFGSIDIRSELEELTTISDPSSYVGCLYSYNADGDLSIHEPGGIICANGIGWTADDKTMYFTDSALKRIWAYDFDPVTGHVSNKRTFVDRSGMQGEPDGLLVDTSGYVYTFLWDGAGVAKYDSTGKLCREWRVNASRVTHGAWVGKDLDQLILTSAQSDNGSCPWVGEEGGALFWIDDAEGMGVPKHKFRGRVTAPSKIH